MPLLIEERTAEVPAALLLGDGPLPVHCRVTIEWLNGIGEPTWYGYFTLSRPDIRMLPGHYRAVLLDQTHDVMLRRPCMADGVLCFPFWGLAGPPDIPKNVPAEAAVVGAGDEPPLAPAPPALTLPSAPAVAGRDGARPRSALSIVRAPQR